MRMWMCACVCAIDCLDVHSFESAGCSGQPLCRVHKVLPPSYSYGSLPAMLHVRWRRGASSFLYVHIFLPSMIRPCGDFCLRSFCVGSFCLRCVRGVSEFHRFVFLIIVFVLVSLIAFEEEEQEEEERGGEGRRGRGGGLIYIFSKFTYRGRPWTCVRSEKWRGENASHYKKILETHCI